MMDETSISIDSLVIDCTSLLIHSYREIKFKEMTKKMNQELGDPLELKQN